MGKFLSKTTTSQTTRSSRPVSCTNNSTSQTTRLSIASQVDLDLCLKACANGDLTFVKIYLKGGGNIDYKTVVDGTEWTPLLIASCHGHVQVIKLLIEHMHGAQTYIRNNDGWSALMVASQNGHCEVVKLLLEYHALVNLQNNDGWSALMVASKNGHCKVVKLLLEYHALVNLQNNNGWSALMVASKNGHCEVVKLLHEYGAQVDLQNNDGWSALMAASKNGHCKVVKLLHEYGAQVDLQSSDGWSALMLASKNGRYKVVKLLHEYGAQVDLQDSDGWSALMIASENGHCEVVKLLHEYGAQVDLQDNDGWSALMIASQNGHCELVKLLHEYGAQVDLHNNDGWSALMAASKDGHCDIVELLHDNGAQVDLQNNYGWSALMAASLYGHCEIVKRLCQEYGAQIDLLNNNGSTALMLAKQSGHSKTVEVLHSLIYNPVVEESDQPHSKTIKKSSHDNSLKLVSQTGDVEQVESLLNGSVHSQQEIVDALLLASKNGHNNVVKLIIKRCGNVNSTDDNGQSALIVASQHGHSEVVKTLIEHGAQVDMQDKNGMSSLMFASQNGHQEILKMLIRKGAQHNIQNNEGWSALVFAGWNCRTETIDVLLKHGAYIDPNFVNVLSFPRHSNIVNFLMKRIEADNVERKHLAAVQEAIEQQGSLTHTTVHGVIVGLARSGKDTLMKRFLGEMPSDKSPSTGVAEKVIQVRVEKPTTIAANVKDSKWTKLTEYDDEAVEMMTQLTAKQTQVKQKEPPSVKQEHLKSDQKGFDIIPTKDTERPSTHGQLQMKKQALKYHVHSDVQVQSADYAVCSSTSITHMSPTSIFKGALKNKGLDGLREHLKNHWSLYLSNTGGQMEFQELLPLLVSGPSMIFVTFRLDRDLNDLYEIEYEVAVKADDSSKFKSFQYTSSATPLETILQTLASFDAVGTYDYSKQQRERVALTYKVFIIGTHRDILEKSHGQEVATKIQEIDNEIQKVVRDASYYRHVQFAARDQMIFTVNNFSESDSDFQHIRSSVQRVIDTGDFRMTTPSHWLIYSLVLRQLKSRIESYDNCFRIARDCGITSHEEHKEALHFIHTKMGLIRYIPQDELDQVVFLDPQALFDRVTELITDTFTFEKGGKQIEDDFKRGIFSFSDFEKLQCSDTLLNPSRFAKVLEHLRIVAPFHQDGILKYFLPCAIPHADKPQEISTQTSQPIPPLVVSFECGYRPMGLAGALIKYLMTNEGQSKYFTWNILTDEIIRDQVSFVIEPSCDKIVLKMFPTHIEVTFLPDPNDSERVGYPIEKVCHEVWKTIQAGIERVNSDINYIRNTEPSFTFYCQLECCKMAKFHQVKLFPEKLFCPKSKKSCKLPNGYKTWILHEHATVTELHTHHTIKSGPDIDVRCNSCHHALLLTQLKEHAAEWKDIGTHLGFSQGELSNIESAPKHFTGAPKSWLSAMLAEWLEWAPGDERGSKNYATLSGLKSAVREAGLGRTAEELTLSNTSPK